MKTNYTVVDAALTRSFGHFDSYCSDKKAGRKLWKSTESSRNSMSVTRSIQNNVSNEGSPHPAFFFF